MSRHYFRFIDVLELSVKRITVWIGMYLQQPINPIRYQYATKYKSIKLCDRSEYHFEVDAKMSELIICDIINSSHIKVICLEVPTVSMQHTRLLQILRSRIYL